jgi:hypothetical protein
MTLYHGGLVEVTTPRIIRGNRVGDFGIGFYTTTDLEQARRFVQRKCFVAGQKRGVVSVYSVSDSILSGGMLKVRRFDSPDEDWVGFVFANRRQPDFEHGFDIVYGPVANDQVYASLSLFEDGQIGQEELIRRLMSRKLVDQLLFHTERALEHLAFEGSQEVVCREK